MKYFVQKWLKPKLSDGIKLPEYLIKGVIGISMS